MVTCLLYCRSVPIDPSAVFLTDRVAVVTGAGSGIGRGIATGFAAFGAKVAIWERDPETCAAAAEEVGGLSLPTDVRESAQVDRALERTVAELGPVSILVNNAGGVFSSPLLDTTENGWDALYRANLKHVILCTQRVARVMVAHGIGGSIMSVTSIEGVRAAPGYAAYAAAKAGVINYTKTAALELAPHGIRVNALAPDITMTEGIRAIAPEGAEGAFGLTVPMGRAGHVDEMAGAAVFLASELSSYITGQTIHVDGGTHAASGWYHRPGRRRLRARPVLAEHPIRSAVSEPDMGGHSAVDGEHLPRDVAGLVGGQEHHDVGDVLGLAHVGVRVALPRPASIFSSRCARTASVMMRPGRIVLTRMPCFPWLVATYMVSAFTPALETP